MYRRLCRLKITTRLFLIISIAVAGFMAMASITLVRDNTAARNAASFRELAELAPVVGQLIHELQKERGASAIYIGTSGSDASLQTLAPQKNRTDEAWAEFSASASPHSRALEEDGLRQAFAAARGSLGKLESTRQAVIDQSASDEQMFFWYTITIKNLLAVISNMEKLSDNSQITKRFIAYNSFMEAKERTGQERAVGATGFSAGKFEGRVLNQLLSLIAKQEAFQQVFEQNASPTSVSLTNKTIAGPAIQQYLKLRDIALNGSETGITATISPSYWFKTITAKIDLMKQVEDHLVAELVTLYQEAETRASRNFSTLLASSLAISLIILGGALIIAHSISKPLDDITTAMHEIAEGNLEREVPHETMQNAIGRIARALYTFKIKVIENIALEKQAHQLRQREDERRRLKFEIKTAEKARAELQRSRDKAEISSRAKSEFLANMSHELRTPLNAIIGFSDLIKSGLLGDKPIERSREYAADINESGIHLMHIINDILDLSKIEANKINLQIHDAYLIEMIRSALLVLSQRTEEKRLKISMKESSFKNICLIVDERRFKQILLNLLSNAIKFTPEGGKIEITAINEADKGFKLVIKDNGIGMRPEDVPRAMSPFYQIDSSLSRKYQGTGLGLPLVKEFTELHDGTFDLKSQLGGGTTATVWLPASRVIVEETYYPKAV